MLVHNHTLLHGMLGEVVGALELYWAEDTSNLRVLDRFTQIATTLADVATYSLLVLGVLVINCSMEVGLMSRRE